MFSFTSLILTVRHFAFILTCALLFVYAPSNFAAPLEGIGVIDVRFAVFQTKRAKTVSDTLSKKAESSLKTLSTLEQDLRFLEQKLGREKDTLSPKKQKELVDEIQQKGTQYQQLRVALQNAKAAEEQKLLLSYRPALETAITKIVADNKIVLLLNREAVAYLDKKYSKRDFTKQLIAALDAWDIKQAKQ